MGAWLVEARVTGKAGEEELEYSTASHLLWEPG